MLSHREHYVELVLGYLAVGTHSLRVGDRSSHYG